MILSLSNVGANLEWEDDLAIDVFRDSGGFILYRRDPIDANVSTFLLSRFIWKVDVSVLNIDLLGGKNVIFAYENMNDILVKIN